MTLHLKTWHFFLFAVALSWFAADPVAQAGTVRVYVTNSAGDSVHVVDPATNQVVQVFKGPEAAHGVSAARNPIEAGWPAGVRY